MSSFKKIYTKSLGKYLIKKTDDEEGRKKISENISSLIIKADETYKQLSQVKPVLQNLITNVCYLQLVHIFTFT